jgi:hypothetical protein
MRTTLALALALGTAACSPTKIVSSDPMATIIADGRMSKGQLEIGRYGLPGSETVIVRNNAGHEQRAELKRRFTGLTLLTGLFTYGVCLLFCWEYPETLLVQMPTERTQSSWDDGPGDPWLQAPAGYVNRSAAPAPQTPAPPPAPAPR